MGKRSWRIHFFLFKTVGKFGPQILTVPGPLKAALNKVRPIAFAKNAKGFIFLTNKWKRMSRSQFSAMIKWVYKTYAKKSWTQNTVRSIKVSSVFSGENPLKLATEMAHGIETQLLHYRTRLGPSPSFSGIIPSLRNSSISSCLIVLRNESSWLDISRHFEQFNLHLLCLNFAKPADTKNNSNSRCAQQRSRVT